MNSRFLRILFACSLLLNLVLLGKISSVNHRSAGQAALPQPQPGETGEAHPAPFRWSRLEAPDYPTYIANLRAIGCPEQTVREIVAADVDDVYASRRQPLLDKINAAGGASAEINQAQSTLAQLRLEEAAVFRKLFGISDPEKTPVNATAQAASPPSRARDTQPVSADINVSMPLVFQSVDTNRLQLTAEQLKSMDEVRQSFQAMMGTNQDVNSPEYLRRWQTAQKQADNMMGALIGRQAQLDYEDAVQSQQPAGN